MSSKIRHSGIVEEVGFDGMKVKILQTSACAGCKVAGHCNASESKEKIVHVSGRGMADNYSKGDSVVVAVSSKMGMKAVGIAFVIPFAILVTTIFIMKLLTGNEAVSAIIGICALVPYYGLLYVFRNKLSNSFVFTIES